MPILDHFHPPLSIQRFWSTFHHQWAATIARRLNREILPADYFAVPNIQFGPKIEIDVGAFQENQTTSNGPASTAIVTTPPSTMTVPSCFLDTIRVNILRQEGGPQIVAAIELVSPSNKDRDEHRRAFAAKMGTYLHQCLSLIVIDIVTNRSEHLHNDWVEMFRVSRAKMDVEKEKPLFANSYRPFQEGEQSQVEIWAHPLAVGACLPTLPLFLTGDLVVHLPLEETYLESCEDQRIAR